MGLSRKNFHIFFSISTTVILSLLVLSIISLVFSILTPLEEDTFLDNDDDDNDDNDVPHSKVLLTVFEGITIGYLLICLCCFCDQRRKQCNCSCLGYLSCGCQNFCCRCLSCLCTACDLSEVIRKFCCVGLPVIIFTGIGIFCTYDKKDKFEDWSYGVKNRDYFNDSKKYNKAQFIVLVIKGAIIILYPFIIFIVTAIASCFPSCCIPLNKNYIAAIQKAEEEEKNEIMDPSEYNYN